MVDWQSALYAFVLLLGCVFLVPLTKFWWVVLLLAVAAPIALAVLSRGTARVEKPRFGRKSEEELLEALAEWGSLTPATAAMRTSLTVEEASKSLDGLVAGGNLELHVVVRDRAHTPGSPGDGAARGALARARAGRAAAGGARDPAALAG